MILTARKGATLECDYKRKGRDCSMIIDFMIAMLLVYLCAASLVRLARRQFGLVVYNWIAAVAWALGESGTCLEIPFKRVYYRRASFSTWTSLQYQVIVYCLAYWCLDRVLPSLMAGMRPQLFPGYEAAPTASLSTLRSGALYIVSTPVCYGWRSSVHTKHHIPMRLQ